jgi:hypothetical protein
VPEPRSAPAALLARHPALPGRQPEADRPGAVRYAAWRLLPAVPEGERSESAAPLRAAAQAEVSGRARPLPAADRVRHLPEAMACRRAQPPARRAQARLPVVSAQRAVSQPRAASWRAVVAGASPAGAAAAVRQPEGPVVAEEPRQVAGAVRAGAAAGPQPAAGQAAAGVQRQAAAVRVAAAAVLRREAVPDAEGQPRAARGEPVAARPSAAAWAAPPCLPEAARPGPSAAARFAHAMRG